MSNEPVSPGNATGPSRRWVQWLLWPIVIVIVGFATWITVPLEIQRRRHEEMGSRESSMRAELTQLGVLLGEFHKRCGTYPSTEQGLDALRKKPEGLDCPKYEVENISHLPPSGHDEDVWGVPLKYFSDGKHYRIEASHGLSVEGP